MKFKPLWVFESLDLQFVIVIICMNIWYTTTPSNIDMPIWAYRTHDPLRVVVLYQDWSIGLTQVPLTWTHAHIPELPVDAIHTEYQRLADKEGTTEWRASDWFRAGVEYGLIMNKTSKGYGPIGKEVW